MRPILTGTVFLALLASPALGADLFSKSYAFKAGTRLEIGMELPNGVKIDAIRFAVPEDGSAPRAEIEIANLGKGSAKIGIAIALLDTDNRLVAAANGGTKMFPLRTDRQMTYNITLDGVYGEAAAATSFKLAVEAR